MVIIDDYGQHTIKPETKLFGSAFNKSINKYSLWKWTAVISCLTDKRTLLCYGTRTSYAQIQHVTDACSRNAAENLAPNNFTSASHSLVVFIKRFTNYLRTKMEKVKQRHCILLVHQLQCELLKKHVWRKSAASVCKNANMCHVCKQVTSLPTWNHLWLFNKQHLIFLYRFCILFAIQ